MFHTSHPKQCSDRGNSEYASPTETISRTAKHACSSYLDANADYFIDIYEGRVSPGSTPRWPDGGHTPPTVIRSYDIPERMSQESPAEEPLSMDELTALLAEAEGTTPEAIERGGEKIQIAPPSEADVIEQ